MEEYRNCSKHGSYLLLEIHIHQAQDSIFADHYIIKSIKLNGICYFLYFYQVPWYQWSALYEDIAMTPSCSLHHDVMSWYIISRKACSWANCYFSIMDCRARLLPPQMSCCHSSPPGLLHALGPPIWGLPNFLTRPCLNINTTYPVVVFPLSYRSEYKLPSYLYSGNFCAERFFFIFHCALIEKKA